MADPVGIPVNVPRRTELGAAAFSNSYDDLDDKPTIPADEVTASTVTDLLGILYGDGDNVGTLIVGSGLTLSGNTLSTAGGGSIGGSTGATDNAILRADGTGGATLQNSGVTISDNSEVLIVSGAVGAKPLCVRAAASQTANLQEWQNSAGTVLAGVTSACEIFAGRFRSSASGTSNLYLDEGLRKRWDLSNGQQGQYVISGSNFDGGGNFIFFGTTAVQYAPGGANHRLSVDCANRILFLGGRESTSPQAASVSGVNGSGTNVASAKTTIQAGRSTGDATPAVVAIASTTAGSSGTTLQTVRDCLHIDGNTTSGETPMLLLDIDKGTLQRVSVGSVDSGGTGYKVLRVPN